MNDLKKKLEDNIFQHGFDVVGYSPPTVDKRAKKEYLYFLNKNYHGEMKWLERHFEKKIEPKKMWDKVKSIVVIGLNYAPKKNPLFNNLSLSKANISVYAQNEDYHEVIKIKLKKIQSWLLDEYNLDSRVFVDSSPIFEKYFAKIANLGWQGKHTNIVSKEYGSWLFLAEIFLPIEIKDLKSQIQDNCGSCNKCIDICPTNALINENKIDARKCISYLTIENKGPIPFSLRKKIGNKVYGCDDCLSICPWNKFSSETTEEKLQSSIESKTLAFFLKFNKDKFQKYFCKSPIKRIGWTRFLRNLIIATGNSQNKNLIKYLHIHLNNESSLIRGTCIWSLFQLINKREKRELREKILKTETNKYVLFELGMLC